MRGWELFWVYYVVAMAAFGAHHVVWARRRRKKGEPVTSPVGQLIFVVIAAPIALLLVAALVWRVITFL